MKDRREQFLQWDAGLVFGKHGRDVRISTLVNRSDGQGIVGNPHYHHIILFGLREQEFSKGNSGGRSVKQQPVTKNTIVQGSAPSDDVVSLSIVASYMLDGV